MNEGSDETVDPNVLRIRALEAENVRLTEDLDRALEEFRRVSRFLGP